MNKEKGWPRVGKGNGRTMGKTIAAGGREEQWMNILHRIIKLLELLSKEKSENFIHLPC